MDFWSGTAWVVSKIPGAALAARKYAPKMSGMRIVSPAPGNTLPEGKVVLAGTCHFRPEGDWIIFKRMDTQFWPQGDIRFPHNSLEWTAALWMAPKEPPDGIKILVTRIDKTIRYAVDYYWKNRELTNYSPLELDHHPAGMTVIQEVTYFRTTP